MPASTEVLRRLDDTAPEVRRAAAAAVPPLLAALPPDYCPLQWRPHLEHFAKTLLVFLDDTDGELQDLVQGESASGREGPWNHNLWVPETTCGTRVCGPGLI